MVKAKALLDWGYTPPEKTGGGGLGLDEFGVPFRFRLKKNSKAEVTILHGLEDCFVAHEAKIEWDGDWKNTELLSTYRTYGIDEDCPLASLRHDWLRASYSWFLTVVEHTEEYGDQRRLLAIKQQSKSYFQELSENEGGLKGRRFKVSRGDGKTSPRIGEMWYPLGACDKGFLQEHEVIDYKACLSPDKDRIEKAVKRLTGTKEVDGDDGIPWDGE